MNAAEPNVASKASRLEIERGKPSIRNGPRSPPIAFCSSRTVVSDATILPWSITAEISRPSSEPERTSCRTRYVCARGRTWDGGGGAARGCFCSLSQGCGSPT